MNVKPLDARHVLNDIRQFIDTARQRVAQQVNAELSQLYWHIGQRLRQETLGGERAEYGKQIIATVSQQLTREYGKGWSQRQLWLCMQLAQTFPDQAILNTLCAELSWSHLRLLLGIEDSLKRNFYVEICRLEHWSVRQLQERIQSMLYERTAISKKPEATIERDLQQLRQDGQLSADLAFRDPYLLDFLGLSDSYSEKDLESAIVAELQRFIIELGNDFAFLARQKRITIDHCDYYLDLLFYHRRLKCLVAIELKIGEFEAAHKGQMELYLRHLEKHEQMEGENTPIGLILCAGKNQEHVELLQLDKSNIRVADYLTLLPPKALLETKLHLSIEIARQRLAQGDVLEGGKLL
ncbi:MAG TPA: PDDEXK nuclease domain-containing protein [Pseudomonadales bacterium]|nr:PDDEXK nuclease domain-containing protein [Pseudomonadales bacterium]